MDYTVSNIVKSCANCKEARGMFKEMIAAGMERKKAQDMIKRACDKINDRNGVIKSDNDNARAWLKKGENVLRSVFPEYVRSAEFKKAYKGKQFQGGVDRFIDVYFPVLTSKGTPVRKTAVFVDGVRFYRYVRIEGDRLTRTAAFGLLDSCTASIYKERIGTFRQRRGR